MKRYGASWPGGGEAAKTRPMIILLLVIHIMVAIALVAVILLQKSEGGALGMGGGGMSGFMTGRSTANLLTRATAILAAAFMTTSVLLVVMHNRRARAGVDHRPARPSSPGRSVGADRSDGPGQAGKRRPRARRSPIERRFAHRGGVQLTGADLGPFSVGRARECSPFS